MADENQQGGEAADDHNHADGGVGEFDDFARPVMDKLSVPVVDLEGKSVGTLEIDPADFGGYVNQQLLHDAVVMYQANRRQGNAKTKTRTEVAGSKKKLFRQKGTGNARVGTKRTNKRRGGGTAHGPLPRSYRYAMPKQARQLATKMAFLSKFVDNEAVVLDALAFDDIKTKRMAGILKAVGVGDDTCLIATPEADRNVYLSGRNIKGVEVMPVKELNAFALLRGRRLLISRQAVEGMQEFARRQAEGRGRLVAETADDQTPASADAPAAVATT